MRKWIRVRDGRIKRPCWVPEGTEVRWGYIIPPWPKPLEKYLAPEFLEVIYPVPPAQRLIEPAARRLVELEWRIEEAYLLGLTAAYRAIGPAWQVRFIPAMAWWTDHLPTIYSPSDSGKPSPQQDSAPNSSPESGGK